MTDKAENIIVAGLDQDYAACVEVYDDWTPEERGELAEWLAGRKGDIRYAPTYVRSAATNLASLAFVEVGLRWSRRHEVDWSAWLRNDLEG